VHIPQRLKSASLTSTTQTGKLMSLMIA